MTIQIDTIARTPSEAVLTVAGRLADGAVPLLDGELSRLLADAGRVVVDLRGVQFIDNRGLALLRRVALKSPADPRGPRVQLSLRNGSPFLRQRLASRGLVVG
jgi:anti-anti-sigma regulatory factor